MCVSVVRAQFYFSPTLYLASVLPSLVCDVAFVSIKFLSTHQNGFKLCSVALVVVVF